MYELIAREYERLFPLDPRRVQLAVRLAGGQPADLLDIGCASGQFARELAGQRLADATPAFHVVGIDPDAGLLAQAAKAAQAIRASQAAQQGPSVATAEQSGLPDFRLQGMLDISEASAYDQIYCMGNTLPHLAGPAEIADFLGRSRKALRPGGHLILQLINFEPLLKLPEHRFPVLETDTIRFVRLYRNISADRLDFVIELSLHTGGATQQATLPLYPVCAGELAKLLAAAGFSELKLWSSYEQEAFSGQESHYLALARSCS